jgi:hypothetical protein
VIHVDVRVDENALRDLDELHRHVERNRNCVDGGGCEWDVGGVGEGRGGQEMKGGTGGRGDGRERVEWGRREDGRKRRGERTGGDGNKQKHCE